jgi:hypothetical protein
MWYSRPVLLAASVPADSDHRRQYMEHALAGRHQADFRRLPTGFGFARHRKNVTLLVRSLPELAAAAASQLAARYPAATMSRLADDAPAGPPGSATWSAGLRLRPDLFPIRLRRLPRFHILHPSFFLSLVLPATPGTRNPAMENPDGVSAGPTATPSG